MSGACVACHMIDGAHKCTACEKRFGDVNDLRAHLDRNFNTCATKDSHVLDAGASSRRKGPAPGPSTTGSANDLQFRCPLRDCGEKFASADALEEHRQRFHRGDAPDMSKKVFCGRCNTMIAAKGVARHRRLHVLRGPGPLARGPVIGLRKRALSTTTVMDGFKIPRQNNARDEAEDEDEDEDEDDDDDVNDGSANANDGFGGFDFDGVGDDDDENDIALLEQPLLPMRVIHLMTKPPEDEVRRREIPTIGSTFSRPRERGAGEATGVGYAIGPSASGAFVPLDTAPPLKDGDADDAQARASDRDGGSDNDDDDGDHGVNDNSGAGGGAGDDADDNDEPDGDDDDDDDDVDDENDDDVVRDPSEDEVRRQLRQFNVTAAAPVSVDDVTFADEIDVASRTIAPHGSDGRGRRFGSRALLEHSDETIERTQQFQSMLLNFGLSRSEREMLLAWTAAKLCGPHGHGDPAVLATDYLAMQAVGLVSPLPVVQHATVIDKSGRPVELAYYDVAEVAALAAARALMRADGDFDAAFRRPSAQESAAGRSALEVFERGHTLLDSPPMPTGPWSSASYAHATARFEAVAAAHAHDSFLLTLVQFTADETRVAGRKMTQSRVRFLWDPSLEWYEIATFDGKRLDRHLVWSTALLPGVQRLQHGVRVKCVGDTQLLLAGDIVSLIGDKEFFYQVLDLKGYPSVHNPALSRSADWMQSQKASARVLQSAEQRGEPDEAAPTSANVFWRSIDALKVKFDEAQEAHAAALRSNKASVLKGLSAYGMRATMTTMLGGVSIGANDASALSRAIREGEAVLHRPLLLDHRLSYLQSIGSLGLPNCTLHQHQQGLLEHMLEKVAFSIGVNETSELTKLVSSMPRTPLWDFSQQLFFKRKGKVSKILESVTPAMSGKQRLHLFRLVPLLLDGLGHSAFARLCASYLWLVDEVRRGADSRQILYRLARWEESLVACVDVFRMPASTKRGREFADESTSRARKAELLLEYFAFPKTRDEWHLAATIWCGGPRATSAGSSESKHQIAKDSIANHSSAAKLGDSVLARDQLFFATRAAFLDARASVRRVQPQRAAVRSATGFTGVLKAREKLDDAMVTTATRGSISSVALLREKLPLDRANDELRVAQTLRLRRLDASNDWIAAGQLRVDQGILLDDEGTIVVLLLLLRVGNDDFALVESLQFSDSADDLAVFKRTGVWRAVVVPQTLAIVQLTSRLIVPLFVTACDRCTERPTIPLPAAGVLVHTFLQVHLQ
jgi:hypothetical protein